MYVSPNSKTKKEPKAAVQSGRKVLVWSPGPFPVPLTDGISVEGPHYPEPHRWYARVEVRHDEMGNYFVQKVVS